MCHRCRKAIYAAKQVVFARNCLIELHSAILCDDPIFQEALFWGNGRYAFCVQNAHSPRGSPGTGRGVLQRRHLLRAQHGPGAAAADHHGRQKAARRGMGSILDWTWKWMVFACIRFLLDSLLEKSVLFVGDMRFSRPKEVW